MDWTQIITSAIGGGALVGLVTVVLKFVLSKDKPLLKRISDLEVMYGKCMERDGIAQREIGALQHRLAVMESESHPVAVIVADAAGMIIEWNTSATVLFGWSTEEAKGKYVTMLVPNRLRDQHDAAFAKNVSAEISPLAPEARRILESFGLRRDGTEVPVTVTLSRFMFRGDRFYTAEIKKR